MYYCTYFNKIEFITRESCMNSSGPYEKKTSSLSKLPIGISITLLQKCDDFWNKMCRVSRT